MTLSDLQSHSPFANLFEFYYLDSYATVDKIYTNVARCAVSLQTLTFLYEFDNVYILYYKNKNWLQFLFIVKAAVLKQQISKFYPQILSTEASDHIYFSQRPFINVKAIFCA